MSVVVSEHGVTVTIDLSGASDRAPVVFVDTSDELEAPDGPMIRIRLNDNPVYIGIERGEELDEDDDDEEEEELTA